MSAAGLVVDLAVLVGSGSWHGHVQAATMLLTCNTGTAAAALRPAPCLLAYLGRNLPAGPPLCCCRWVIIELSQVARISRLELAQVRPGTTVHVQWRTGIGTFVADTSGASAGGPECFASLDITVSRLPRSLSCTLLVSRSLARTAGSRTRAPTALEQTMPRR